MNRDLLRAELIRDEGSRKDSEGRHIAYKDSLGFWTIGYGHLMGDKPTMVSCTEETARALLDKDINSAEHHARRMVPLFDNLTDSQQRAVVNLFFNRGPGNMARSTRILPAILEASAGGSWVRVREAIAGSQWAAQVKDRAERIADLFDPKPPADEGFA